MNIAVIGLGSMGKRRIRLLKSILGNSVKIYGVESNEERRLAVQAEYGITGYGDLEKLFKEVAIDAVFISTSPLAHASLISICLENGVHVFTEINLVATDYDKNMELAKKQGKILFLSSTMLYRRELQYVAQQVKDADCMVNYSYHVGQYLPDWHPWDVLADFFISKKVTNGCRELFAIELPWIIDAFGPVSEIEVRKSRASKLPIDYADNYILLVEHESGHKGMLAVDVVSREPVRDLTVFGENIFLHWDGTPHGLTKKNLNQGRMEKIKLYDDIQAEHVAGYSNNIVENAYADEICNFLNIIRGIEMPRYTFAQDKELLALIDKIEAE